MRRSRLVFGAVTVLALGAGILLMQADHVTPENYARLPEGMSEGDVVAILGSPSMSRTDGWHRDPRAYSSKTWVGRQHLIAVEFDERGQVVRTLLADASFIAGTPPTLFDRLRSWAGM